jgi:hypothetical protein
MHFLGTQHQMKRENKVEAKISTFENISEIIKNIVTCLWLHD